MKRFILLTFLLLIAGMTPILSNLWGILTDKAYRIPKESHLLTFSVIKMNEGSGGHWLYAEDNRYYYSQMQQSDNAPYIKIRKTDAQQQPNFNATDYRTWSPHNN